MTRDPIRQLKFRVGLSIATILAAVVLASAWNLATERSQALRRAEMRSAGYARALAEHSESAFSESDRVLRDVLHDLARAGGVRRVDRRTLHEDLRRQAEGAPQIGSLFMAARDGEMFVNSLEYPQKPINVADRDYFRHYLDTPGADLSIGRPVVSRLVGRWRFNLMRPLNRPSEPFDGLVAVAFEVEYFRHFLNQDALGPDGRVLLLRLDGAPLVHEPYSEGAYRRDFGGLPLFREEHRGRSHGTFREARSAIDNVPRIVSWHRVSRFPVVAAIALAEADVLAPWRARALVQATLTAALCLLVLLLTRILFRHLDRLRETQRTLADQREQQARLEDQLRHIQKIEAIGQLAGGVAHDFNNLLTPIIVSAELARRALHPGDPLNARLEGVLSAASKAKELTQKLLSFARRQMLSVSPVDLGRVVAEFREILRRTIREEISIDLEVAPGRLTIQADQGQLEQILLNLAVNAQDAIEGPGRIRLSVGRVSIGEGTARENPGMRTGEHVFLAFSDSGCGMGEDVMAHVFEPFFTTKPVGKGTGLGLATVYGIVKQHGGYVGVDSRPGGGTTFTLYFPACDGQEERAGDGGERVVHEIAPGDCDVLVVEDNEMVRSLLVGMLGTFGYRVREAGSPAEALRIAGDPSVPIDLLVSDVIMPDMNGQELYGRIFALRPGVPVLFISGYTQDAPVPSEGEGGRVRFLKKPFAASEFLSAVRSALGAP